MKPSITSDETIRYGTNEKEEVQAMFDRIAPTYDVLNHTLSANIDRLWRRRVVRCVAAGAPAQDPRPGHRHGRPGAGAGPGRARGPGAGPRPVGGHARRRPAQGGGRGLDARVLLERGDAEHLALADASVDAVTVAFGVRNFGDLECGLREMARVLKPGGRAVVLEFSTPRNPLFRTLYGWYNRRVLPPRRGAGFARPPGLRVPARLDRRIPGARTLRADDVCDAGFRTCRARSQSFGIAQIYTAER